MHALIKRKLITISCVIVLVTVSRESCNIHHVTMSKRVLFFVVVSDWNIVIITWLKNAWRPSVESERMDALDVYRLVGDVFHVRCHLCLLQEASGFHRALQQHSGTTGTTSSSRQRIGTYAGPWWYQSILRETYTASSIMQTNLDEGVIPPLSDNNRLDLLLNLGIKKTTREQVPKLDSNAKVIVKKNSSSGFTGLQFRLILC